MINPQYFPLPPPPTLDQRLRLIEFDEDPYNGISSLMLNEAYASVPDHYLDVEHPEHEPNLLAHHVTLQIQRVLIDLVNNCRNGAEYERFIAALRNRYAGIET